MQTIKQTIITLIICLAVVAGVSVVSAWTGPTQTPPDGNTPAPINTSATSQIKSGPLQVNGFRNLGNSIFDGNVGIGTTTPGAKLDISGGVRIGDDAAACSTTKAGTIRYSSGAMQYCNGADWTALGAPASHGSQIYTSPGSYTFTVPTGVTTVRVTMSGGGGGGGGGSGGSVGVGFGGAGGRSGTEVIYSFTPGQQLSVTPGANYTVSVGAGGGGGAGGLNVYVSVPGVPGAPGGSSSFGTLLTIAGGTGGAGGAYSIGGATGGNGSGSAIGIGGAGGVAGTAGGAGTGIGAGGGGGGGGSDSSVGVGAPGGRGAPGCVLVEW